MDLKDILESREKQIDKCEYYIKLLNSYSTINGSKELKNLLQSKKILFTSMNIDISSNFLKELLEINKKISIQYNIIKLNITNDKELRRFEIDFIDLLKLSEDNFNFNNIKKIILNNQFFTTLILLSIGGLIFSIYSIKIDHFPNLNRESFIYYLSLFIGIAIFISLLFMLIPIFSYICVLDAFKNKWVDPKKIPYILLVFIFPVIIFYFFISTEYQIAFLSNIIANFIAAYLLSSKLFDNFQKFSKTIGAVFIPSIFISFIIAVTNEIISDKNIDIIDIIEINLIIILPYLSIVYLGVNQIKNTRIVLSAFIGITLIVCIFFPSSIIKKLHFGNYTPNTLILKSEARAIIPKNFIKESANPTENKEIYLEKPKVLSNIGDEYYIELKESNTKAIRLSIPKKLVLSEQNEVEEKLDESKDTKQHSKPKENTSQ